MTSDFHYGRADFLCRLFFQMLRLFDLGLSLLSYPLRVRELGFRQLDLFLCLLPRFLRVRLLRHREFQLIARGFLHPQRVKVARQADGELQVGGGRGFVVAFRWGSEVCRRRRE